MSPFSREAPLTRDQIQAKLESVKTRITLLKAMRDTTNSELDKEDSRVKDVQKDRDDKAEALKKSTETLEEARKVCWLGGHGICEAAKKEAEVSKALSDSSAANLRLQTLEFQFGAKSQMKDQIDIVLAKLTLESEQLESQLAESKPSSSSSLVDDVGTTEPFEPQEIQDNWAMFDFSSTKSSKESSSSSVETSTTVSGSYSFVASASVSASVGHQSFSEHVQSSDVKVKAKVLKVKINRPWFRSELFINREFTLVS